MKILGFDPGTKRLGYGIIEIKNNQLKVIDADCFEPKNRTEEKILEEIFQKVDSLIKKYKPDFISIEKIFFFQNQKTAFQISEVRGVLLLAAAQHQIPIIQPTPLEIKTCLTGYGRAEKNNVALMVKKILKLEKMPRLDDTTDALACSITAYYFLKNNFKIKK
ncbi:MAG: crossover junction endodeoxyribonuclease RuvC [Patescibacteria group bacterium]|jgi:crossover junction endodeoxyribonuclease RuvC|nr:crossover junction endodeoxyribonuclease RuvC [Patescibacteria group bacterium]